MSKRILGLTLIAVGVLVWVIYAALKMTSLPVNGAIALLVHLIFVIPGAILAPGENFYSKIISWGRRPNKVRSFSEEPDKSTTNR
jgi:hypothetical protein